MHLKTLVAALLLVSGAAAATPEAAWKAGIAEQNRAYAQTPHAMLKIQDSVYLGEGQSAVLQGRKGQPGSWRWNRNAGAQGPLRAAIRGGKLSASLSGKPLDPARMAKGVPVDADVDIAGQPTQVGANVPGWRIFVFNQKNPSARDFRGVSYFPYDGKFRVRAQFHASAKRSPRVFRTSRGTDKQFYHVGDAAFTLQGKAVTLPFYADDPKKIGDMSAFFTDGLTGKGAYGAGRYLDASGFGKFPPATLLLDFNQAYNPNCARSAHFTCPLAVDEIDLAVRAGERDPHAPHGNR